jgi:uncharacterized protein DUF5916/cellulose/xylan binding protein with CBM9 domain
VSVVPDCGARMPRGRSSVRLSHCFLFPAMLLLPASVRGGSPPEGDLRIPVRTAVPPRIDGVLDEEAWKEALVIDDFTQQLPEDRVPPTERTEARILYDDDNLYLGIRLYDREPSRILARTLARDSFAISADDQLAFCIDSSNNGRDGFWFSTNPAGVQVDAQIFNEGQVFDNDWDAVWEVSARVDAEGWTAEIRIPFFNLRFSPAPDNVMGINFFRAIRRKNEEEYAPYIPRDFAGTLTLSRARHFRFTGIRRGVRFQLKPYALVRYDRTVVPGPPDTDLLGRAGGDLKWGVTSSLTADLTYRTDFAQVEADIQQVNLTRFKLFYPEKRDFFLENAGLFQFGAHGETDAFFSRRIGLTDAGDVVPILAGGRLTGRVGRTSLGVLDVATDQGAGDPRTNFAVLRVRRDILARSTVGMILTDREASGSGGGNRVAGADTRIVFSDYWSVDAFYAASHSSPDLPEGSASRVRIGRDGDTWQVSARYSQVDPGFDPGIGFVLRSDMDLWQGFAAWKPRPDSDRVRQFTFAASPTYITDRHGELQSRDNFFQFQTSWESGDLAGISYDQQFERLTEDFHIFLDPVDPAKDIVIPPGDYAFASTGVTVSTFPGRRVSSSSTLLGGTFYDGRKTSLSEELILNFSPHFTVDTRYEFNHVLLPEGDFDTNLWITRFNVAVNPKLFGSALVQANDIVDDLDMSLRVDWIHHPGADLFFAYNESANLRRRPGEPAHNGRDATFKLTYLFTF